MDVAADVDAGFGRCAVENTAGQANVADRDRADHVIDREIVVLQLAGINLNLDRWGHDAVRLHVADAGHLLERGDELIRNELGQRSRRQRFGRHRERDDRRLAGIDRLDARRGQIARQLRLRGLHAALHFHQVFGPRRFQAELGDDASKTLLQVRLSVFQTGGACQLVFDGTDDLVAHFVRRRARIEYDDIDDRHADVGELLLAQSKNGENAADNGDRDEDDSEGRERDDKFGSHNEATRQLWFNALALNTHPLAKPMWGAVKPRAYHIDKQFRSRQTNR